MKILVTVGTSGFDDLIQAVDQQLKEAGFEITCQLASGVYVPTNFSHFRFSSEFRDYFEQADLVITHGGAGTVFELLEMRKKILVVPNQRRRDKHQGDLAQYVEQQKLGGVCWDLADLKTDLQSCIESDYQFYRAEAFFYADNILDYFGIPRHTP